MMFFTTVALLLASASAFFVQPSIKIGSMRAMTMNNAERTYMWVDSFGTYHHMFYLCHQTYFLLATDNPCRNRTESCCLPQFYLAWSSLMVFRETLSATSSGVSRPKVTNSRWCNRMQLLNWKPLTNLSRPNFSPYWHHLHVTPWCPYSWSILYWVKIKSSFKRWNFNNQSVSEKWLSCPYPLTLGSQACFSQ